MRLKGVEAKERFKLAFPFLCVCTCLILLVTREIYICLLYLILCHNKNENICFILIIYITNNFIVDSIRPILI